MKRIRKMMAKDLLDRFDAVLDAIGSGKRGPICIDHGDKSIVMMSLSELQRTMALIARSPRAGGLRFDATLEQVGVDFKKTREAIRKIEAASGRRLRESRGKRVRLPAKK